MRIVHLTDVHFLARTPWRRALGKRALGLANLYLRGRAHHYDAPALVPPLLDAALAWEPDLFVCTGDLTALALEAEFDLALATLRPMLEAVPSVIVPGNHDRYARDTARRFDDVFAPWCRGGRWQEGWRGGAGGWPAIFELGDTTVVATDPCRPALDASGRYPDGAIEAAERAIQQARAAGRQVAYLMHYPPLNPDGSHYRRPGHLLHDLDALLASWTRHPPDLILHGHAHRAWQTSLRLGDREVPVVNCGSSSATTPVADRVAGINLIELHGGRVTGAQRIRMEPSGAPGLPGPIGVA